MRDPLPCTWTSIGFSKSGLIYTSLFLNYNDHFSCNLRPLLFLLFNHFISEFGRSVTSPCIMSEPTHIHGLDARTDTYMHSCTHTHTCTHTHMRTHTHAHIHTHTHTHTHIRTHAHTQTHLDHCLQFLLCTSNSLSEL